MRGWELKIDLAKMEAIIKWIVPTNVTKVTIYFGETQNLHNFISSYLVVVAPLHTITMRGKSFEWGTTNKKISMK